MRRLFIFLGTIGLLFAGVATAGLGFLGTKAYVSADGNKRSAIAVVREISKDWSFVGRFDVVDASLVRDAETPRVARFVRNIGRLGRLVSIRDAEQVNFGMSSTKGTTAVVEFQGEFTNGSGKVVVTLRKSDGKMKLLGIKIVGGKLKQVRPDTTA